MFARRYPLATFVLSLLLALATVVTGWSARPLRLGEEVSLERFVLQGGSLADLCDETGTIGKTGSRHGHDCKTCCLSGTAGLPAEGPADRPVPAMLALTVQPAAPHLPSPAQGWNAAAPRGPPTLA